ncbi:hypothetical protein MM236_19250 [Belliella sp. DSM 107340]|uniref:Uncharacterized protein n=1 Tax=Belliella calami TaxID=2923436 RepID=A0ABS9UU37_9BACT|nr:hypothetical protein [Belliella calami]MCH7400141.1 hypothetical protein [Belliella calami]
MSQEEIDQKVESTKTEFQNKVLLVSFDEQSKIAKKLKKEVEVLDQIVLESVPDDRTFNFITLKPAIDKAKEEGHNLLIAIDPENNRVSLVVRKEKDGLMMVLNSHQVAAILFYRWSNSGKYNDLLLLKSVLISDLMDNLAHKGGINTIDEVVDHGDLSTAFQRVKKENVDNPIVGFNIDQQVMHSDLEFEDIVAELIQIEAEQGALEKTMFDYLLEIYFYNGFYKEKTVSLDIATKAQAKQLSTFMDSIRKNPKSLEATFPLSTITDYTKGKKINVLTDKVYPFASSTTNMLKIEGTNYVFITFAPTAEKMTYYISIRESVNSKQRFEVVNKMLDQEIMKVVQMLNRGI